MSRYFDRMRPVLFRHGGTVEKFIGDAVVAVFGYPILHEDDALRAVRAAEDMRSELQALNAEAGQQDGVVLQTRTGINTGEVLIGALGPGSNFAAGDVMNTAARLQQLAAPGDILLGEATWALVGAAVHAEPIEPIPVKGKAEPVRAWRLVMVLPGGEAIPRRLDSPMVGRQIDLGVLTGSFAKSVQESTVQLVTIVGEPGVGKTRLVAELGSVVEAHPDPVRWRQGRCLPYGDAITFWALGEIVKAEAGIFKTDPPEVAGPKIDAVIPDAYADAMWLRQRLHPLLGLDAPEATREENFAAWRTFLERLAEAAPSVFVFEDLHWADDGLLAFVEHLGEYAQGVPMLVVGTARPELYEKAPAWAASARNASRINLSPLSESETARLIANLVEDVLAPEVERVILARSGGNPLYAEEFVRLVRDRGILTDGGSAWSDDVPIPSGIQGLIAARFDALAPERKAMLQDASVIGKVFWSGAVATMGERNPQEVSEALHELSRKELVRPARTSTMEGQDEYAFHHDLVRDVCYAQIPRSRRAERHARAASWIEEVSGERVEDFAEILAYHYSTALELAHAARKSEQAEELEVPALRFLTLAGERALGLDTNAALANLERAMALVPEGHPERPEVLARFGEAAFNVGRRAEAAEALEEAVAAFRASGDIPAAARAMGKLGVVLGSLGDPRQWILPAEALGILEPLGPSPELVAVLTEVARAHGLQGRFEDAVPFAERALALASELGLPRPARALGYRGMARCGVGDPGGLDDFREAIGLASQAGQGREVALLHYNLGGNLGAFEGPGASLTVLRKGMAGAKARGIAEDVEGFAVSTLGSLVDLGELDEALEAATEMAPRLEASGAVFSLIAVRIVQARIFELRGHGLQVADALQSLESAARGTGNPQTLFLALALAALVRTALGQDDGVAAMRTEIEAYPPARKTLTDHFLLLSMVRAALAIRDVELAESIVRGVEPRHPWGEHALVAADAALAEACGDLQSASDAYTDAAARWERFGFVPEQGFALLGWGRCLLGLSRPTEAAPILQEAREIFDRMGAAPALAETKGLLLEASA